eukprot:4722089-Prymnesium_polylepis.1
MSSMIPVTVCATVASRMYFVLSASSAFIINASTRSATMCSPSRFSVSASMSSSGVGSGGGASPLGGIADAGARPAAPLPEERRRTALATALAACSGVSSRTRIDSAVGAHTRHRPHTRASRTRATFASLVLVA